MSTTTTMSKRKYEEEPEQIYPVLLPPYTIGFSRVGDPDGPMIYFNGHLIDMKQIDWCIRALNRVKKVAKKHINAYNLKEMQRMHEIEGWPKEEIEKLAEEYGIRFTLEKSKSE